MGSDHHHGTANGQAGSGLRNRLLIAFGITSFIVIAQAIGSIITGSLALLTDTAHALSDSTGLLVAALPEAAGGEGVGTSPHTARDTATLLRRLGRADLSAARLFEGHVNAVKLIALHGGDDSGDKG